MKPIVYWGLIALLGVIHAQSLLSSGPFYITVLIIIGGCTFFYKKLLLRMDALGMKGNAFLFGMQGLLLLSEPSYINVGLFISIEIVRHVGARKIEFLRRDLASYEEEREQFNETFRIVRSERHDFLKHISALHFMLEKEKNGEVKEYLEQLVEGYEETNLSIKGERGVVAGILHRIYRRGKSSGIDVVYDLDIPLSTLPMMDKEIVALAGNLLENSLDACEEWQRVHRGQAHLTLQFYKRSGLFLLICENDSPPIPAKVLDQLFVSYGNTTKGDLHEGLGTKVISDLVAKHNGYLDFVHNKGKFMVKIKIPAVV